MLIEITLTSPRNPSMTEFAQFHRESVDRTWITDSTSFNFPVDLYDGEILTVEAADDEARSEFWFEWRRAQDCQDYEDYL